LATFNGTKLDSEVGTLVWPNDADFDPAHDWPELIEELGKRAQAWAPAASEPQANKRMEPTRPGSLEALGYLARSNVPDEGRARIVRLTKRGRAAYKTIHDILRNIEREWIAELGPRPFADLKALLTRVWESPLAR
jgi:hypothetical protein